MDVDGRGILTDTRKGPGGQTWSGGGGDGRGILTDTRKGPGGRGTRENIRHISQPTFCGGVAAEIMHSYWNIPICLLLRRKT